MLLGGKEIPELSGAPLSILPAMRKYVEHYGMGAAAAAPPQHVETMQDQSSKFQVLGHSFHQSVSG